MKKRWLLPVLIFVFLFAADNADVPVYIPKLTNADIPAIATTNLGIFIATRGGGILKSTDGGTNFQRLSGSISHLSLINRSYSSLFVDGGDIYGGGGVTQFGISPGLNVSTDGGATFTQVGLDGTTITKIVRGPQGTIYSSTQGSGVYSYKNNTVTPINNGLNTSNINTLYIDETDGEPFLAGGDDGLYKYDFNIQTWINTTVNNSVHAFAEGDNNTIYIATDDKIYETTDNINFNLLPDLVLSGGFNFTSIAYSSNYLYATCSPTNFEHEFPLVNRLNLNGGVWEDYTAGLPENIGIPQDIVVSGNSKYLATSTNFYSGTLAGLWEYNVESLEAGLFVSASFNQFNSYFYAGGAYGDLWATTDINADWIKNDDGLKLNNQIKGFAHGPGGTIVVQSGAVNFQQAIGDPFERRENGLTSVFHSDVAYNSSLDVLVHGGSNGLSYSVDWGAQWNPTNFSGYTDEVKYSEVKNKFFAATLDKIVVSDGSGQTFNTFVDNVNPRDFAINEDVVNWKIGLAEYNDFSEIDETGNKTSLGYTGLGFGGSLENVEWNKTENTWMGSRENIIYLYNPSNSSWGQSSEAGGYILNVNKYTTNFENGSGLLEDEVIFIATYGGGMYSNAALSSLEDDKERNLSTYYLDQNYPNPFNPSTKISWQSPASGHQSLIIYDVLGNKVATLIDEYKPAGSYEFEFEATDLSSGIYLYQLKVGDPSSSLPAGRQGSGQGYVETKKMVLIK